MKVKLLVFLFIFLLSLPIYFVSFVFCQDVENSMLPPPVEIQFSLENVPTAGDEAILKLKVTPLEDMHVDISCLLPVGIESVQGYGMAIRPYENSQGINLEREMIYREVIGLWTGPIKSGDIKEFSFRVKVLDKEKHELIARVEALAKWGIKEEILTIST